MDAEVCVEVCPEKDPDTILFTAILPDAPRVGDILGDLVGGTYRVEKRLFLLGKPTDGVRSVTSIRLMCKEVII